MRGVGPEQVSAFTWCQKGSPQQKLPCSPLARSELAKALLVAFHHVRLHSVWRRAVNVVDPTLWNLRKMGTVSLTGNPPLPTGDEHAASVDDASTKVRRGEPVCANKATHSHEREWALITCTVPAIYTQARQRKDMT
jgi:hypothetical protein